MKQVILILLTILSTNLIASEFKMNDELCLALNIYHEARSESIRGQMAVGMVTLNRARNDKFPSTICKVVWQNKQFSWTHDGKNDTPKEQKAWRRAKLMASYLYKFRIELTNNIDITDGALYYYAHDIVTPAWANDLRVTKVIGGHTFGKN